MSDPSAFPTRMGRARHYLAGHRDGKRAARRLSYLGANPWIARRAREQAALDAEVAERIEVWARSIKEHRELLDSSPGEATDVDWQTVEPPHPQASIADLRVERRRRAAADVRTEQTRQRRERLARARSEIESLTDVAAAEIWLLQSKRSLVFAVYTRAFLRSYSRATTRHAEEPGWLEQITRTEALALKQTVLVMPSASISSAAKGVAYA